MLFVAPCMWDHDGLEVELMAQFAHSTVAQVSDTIVGFLLVMLGCRAWDAGRGFWVQADRSLGACV